VCFSASPTQAEGRATDDVDTFSRVEDWWRTVDDAFLQIDDDQKRLTRETSGCTRRVAEFYGHVWGNDFVAWLQITRAFALLFLYVGFLKILVVSRTYVLATKGRWLSSAFAAFLAITQIAFGEAAWFIVLAMLIKAQDDAPSVSRPRNLFLVRGMVLLGVFRVSAVLALPTVAVADDRALRLLRGRAKSEVRRLGGSPARRRAERKKTPRVARRRVAAASPPRAGIEPGTVRRRVRVDVSRPAEHRRADVRAPPAVGRKQRASRVRTAEHFRRDAKKAPSRFL
jgi:hypothetical protein